MSVLDREVRKEARGSQLAQTSLVGPRARDGGSWLWDPPASTAAQLWRVVGSVILGLMSMTDNVMGIR